MLVTGKEYLDGIRDGRRVYIGDELVEGVTTHPAFRNAARSFAMIYDRKRAPENRDVMTFEEDHNFLAAPWKDWTGRVDELMASHDAPGEDGEKGAK